MSHFLGRTFVSWHVKKYFSDKIFLVNSQKMVTNNRTQLDYKNKIILAPMVRVGTLPMRLLALRHGADIVYTEELIDWKLMKTKRRVNDVLGTIDFVDETDGTIVFRTCDTEKDRVVVQIGTASPERAVQAAKLVEADVAGIDVNMGCPKEFSIKGGMGASLLTNPEGAKNILKALVSAVNIPVTCKIRILPDAEQTLNLAKQLESVGISAIAIHGRTRRERPQHPVHIDVIRKVATNINIPVIGSGGSKDIEKYSDIFKFKEKCGTTSVMIARAAQWNVSIFEKDNRMLPLDKIIKEYLKLCVDYDNTPSNSKYCVQMMLRELQETPKGKKFLECQTLEDICELWDLGEYCHKKQLEYQDKGMLGRREIIPGAILNTMNTEPQAKRLKIDNLIEKNIAFFRAHYADVRDLPKSMLHLYATKNNKLLPIYETQQEDRLFQTVVTFDGKKYASSYWEKNKRFAEQGAALVCALEIGLIDEVTLIQNGSIFK